MRILLITRLELIGCQTGEATQARETAIALRDAGHALIQLYFAKDMLSICSSDGKPISDNKLNLIIQSCDIVHLMPATVELCALWRSFYKKPVLGSSVFWTGWATVFVYLHTICRFSIGMAKQSIMRMFPMWMNYRGVDCFLPNTKAEGRLLMRCFAHNSDSEFVVVHNGFNKPSFTINDLARPDYLPKTDYIVVPAVFAYRKNQLAIIDAMRNLSYDIVFMGGVLHKDYYERCRKSATTKMHFIGYKKSSEKEYWAVLSNARVACLASDCETPGISLLEAAYVGARPVVTKYGGTNEYYSNDAEYLNPCFNRSIRNAIIRAWNRGRLSAASAERYGMFSWKLCAKETVSAYQNVYRKIKGG